MSLSVDDVIQHAVYDPQARRERYLRNRQLKGRPHSVGPPKAGQGSRIVDMNAPMSTLHDAGHVNQTAIRQAASNARQISAIKGRLNDLRAHLKELLAKKKASSSTGTKASTASSTKTAAAPAKPQTAAQKQAAKESLKKAQEARAKQQKAEPNKKPAVKPSLSLDDQIAQTRAVISDVETKLRAAIEHARTQTASNGR